ncbi:MAG: nucleotidyltransferase [Hyphomicrobiales bacterium]|nr:MAG: nucleotidyltransferase [Hyphomicrobiales bacterium]
MSGDDYLYKILAAQAVDTSANSPVRSVQATLAPLLRQWAGGQLLSVSPSGSFAKGTANRSGTDIDLFISLASDTTESLKDVHATLFNALTNAGYQPKRQNVSLNIRVGGVDVDLVPAKHQGNDSGDHSLYKRRGDTWMKTNVAKHIIVVRKAGRLSETRILKLWRRQRGLDFMSFYLELTVIEALRNSKGTLSDNVWQVFRYLRDSFVGAQVVDPANTNNIISSDLTLAEKNLVRAAAVATLGSKTWQDVVK